MKEVTAASCLGKRCGKQKRGPDRFRDSHVTHEGGAQAQELGRKLAQEPQFKHIQAFVVSPLRRTLASFLALLNGIGLKFEELQALGEWSME
jgi:broad specificity phosphatase PhoE